MDNIIVNVNSAFRNKTSHPNSTNFNYKLPMPLKNIIYMRMTSIEVPNINYIIKASKNNNTFQINNINGDASVNTITIPDGNYSSDTFINLVNDLIDSINGNQFEMSISSTTGKLKIESSDSRTFELNFTRTGDTTYQGINYLLGYSNNVYTGQTSYTGDSIINLIANHYFFIKINKIPNVIDNYVNDAFAKIIVNTDKFNVQFEDYDSFISKDKLFRSPVNIDRLDVELVDFRNNFLEFGLHEFSFTLEFGYIYDFNLYKSISNYGIPNGDDRIKFLYK